MVGVDVGGTKISAGVVDDAGRVREHMRTATPSAALIERAITELVAPLVSASVVAVGVSVAGFVDGARSGLIFAPNIPGWTNPDLAGTLATRLGRPVLVENDANAAAWGEATHGAGAGVPDLVCLTVGTGLGGGLVLGGELRRGAWGFAAEYGHLVLVAGGRPCTCGQFGCWEQYVSGGALEAEATQLLRDDPSERSLLRDLAQGDVTAVTGRLVTRAAERGDALAREAFAIIGTHLGVGMAQLAAVLDPARFVIGGGVSEAGELLLAPAREAFARALTAHDHRPLASLAVARLGVDAGLVGAAALARAAALLPADR